MIFWNFNNKSKPIRNTVEFEQNVSENFVRVDPDETESDLDSTDSLCSKDEQAENDSTSNSLNKSHLKDGKSQTSNNENENEQIEESYEFIYKSIDDLETDKLFRAIYLLFGTVCTLALINCLLLGFLINYLLSSKLTRKFIERLKFNFSFFSLI